MIGSSIARWVTIAPATALFAAVAVLPVVLLVALSVSEIRWVQGIAQWRYAGAEHYVRLAGDGLFRAGIANTMLFALGAVGLQIVLGFTLALMCTRVTRGRVFYRTVFILPILVPGIVIGAIWKLMYNFDFGVLNQILGAVGMPAVDWLGNRNTALLAVIVVDVWHWTPFVFLLMLAALESLPEDVYEAARIDGAGFLQELRHITLPLVWPTMMVTLLFRLIVAFKVFDEIYLLTGGGPGTATEVMSYTIYRRFFTEGQIGYGSAMSLTALVVLATLFLITAGATRRRVPR